MQLTHTSVQSTAQATALEKAVLLLKAAGARYKVIGSDGREFGELEVAAPKRTGARRVRVNNFLGTGYREMVKALAVGDTASIQVPDQFKLTDMTDVVRSCARYHIGADNFVLGVDRAARVVQVLRVQ